MKYELVKNNNNKKLFIGVSIIFCAIILIIGTTFAYFSQSIGNNIDSLATTDIANTLIYTENLAYTREGLIPAKEEIAKQAYNLEGTKKCIDDYGYSACSVYEFNIKNIANVSQELVIDMIPTVNTFTNLHIFAYEIDSEGNKKDLIELKKIEKITDVNNIPTYNITSKSTLKPNEDKTYQIIFFVLDTGEDQTAEDANKQFGAGIRINSVTTGKYIVKNYGSNCWKTAEDDPTTLEVFNGINHDTGEVVEMCNGYVEKDDNGYYSINVPSNIGGQEITTLGNSLFTAYYFDEETEKEVINEYQYIKKVTIPEGIMEIEEGDMYNLKGTFLFAGFGIEDPEYSLNVTLPSSLTSIGSLAFHFSSLNSVSIPSNVETIGGAAFATLTGLNNLVFEEDSKLKTIGDSAFNSETITSLTIPKSVISIGHDAFGFSNLTTLTFEEGSQLETIGDSAFNYTRINSVTIPKTVTSIRDYAFSNNSNLTTLTFETGSQLETIGGFAFDSTSISSVTIPKTVTSIGDYAFNNNSNLTTLTFETGSQLETIGGCAFDSTSISSVTIPKTVTSIGSFAFSDNSNLTTLTFETGSQLETIGGCAFDSTSISSVTIPKTVTSIGIYAFQNNSNLTTLTFEEGSQLETIGDHAFYECALNYPDSANYLLLPSTITSMGEYAFSSNPNLKFIKFNGSEDGFGDYWKGSAQILKDQP